MTKIIRIGTAVTLLALVVVAAIGTLAEFLAIAPRALMDEAVKDRRVPSDRDWSAAYAVIQLAARLKQRDATLEFEAGRIAWWQANGVGVELSVRKEYLATSMAHLSNAVGIRPSWGRAWIELANVYLQSNQWNDARKALAKGMALAPYEGDSQWMALWTGFAIWPVLTSEDRDHLLQIAKHVLQNKLNSWVVDPAVNFRREYTLRPLIEPGSTAEWRLNNLVAARLRRDERVRQGNTK